MTTLPREELRGFLDRRQTARSLTYTSADLRGLQLAGLRADGVEFEEADLRDCLLQDVKWKGCNLRDARLEGADFTGAALRMCDLEQARAGGAIFVRARLENSAARGARFDRADFTGAHLTDTDFSRASFAGANLQGAEATGADFRGTDFRGACLREAVFLDADLRGADLTDAIFDGVDFRGADLRGVVGSHPALQPAPGQHDEPSSAMKELAEAMSPIVCEVLRTAGRRGAIDPQTAERLIAEASQQETFPHHDPGLDTLAAVSQVLDDMGDNVLPTLLAALQQPNDMAPPPEVKSMILRLREALLLDETATADDVLRRLFNNVGGAKSPPQRLP